ncbi:MAG: hypothetical protein ACTSO7_08915 [Candidatus Heimdallarchaeota archaeon]
MAAPYILPGIISALHDLFTSLWIGGLAFMLVILIPLVRKFFEDREQGEEFLSKVQIRLKVLAVLSIIGLIVTGILMSRQAALHGALAGPFSFGVNDYSTLLGVKHILMILMVVVAITKGAILDNLKKQTMALKKIRVILIAVNLLLGIAVLVLSGMTGMISVMS